jgi:hypothetical protein
MPRSETNDERADFMARHGLMSAAWNEDGELISAARAPNAPIKPIAERPAGPAAKLADAFASKLKREHDVRFAASHYRPRLDVPSVTDNVPRAVRDREAERGASNKPKRR